MKVVLCILLLFLLHTTCEGSQPEGGLSKLHRVALSALDTSGLDDVIVPYTPAPAVTLSLLTTYSSPSKLWIWTGEATNHSTFLISLNADSLFLRSMFTDLSSLDALFQTQGSGTTFVVLSLESKTDALLEELRTIVLQRIEFMGLNPNYWAAHLLFAPSQKALSDSWIPATLLTLPSALTSLSLVKAAQNSSAAVATYARVDGYWPFVGQWDPSAQYPVAQLSDGTACKIVQPNMTGMVAFFKHDLSCSFAKQILTAQLAGAVGVVIYPSSDNEQPIAVRCTGIDCDFPIGIAASMIDWKSAQSLLSSLSADPSLSFSFPIDIVRGFFAELDGQALFRSPGDIMNPTFEAFVWESDYLQYQTVLNYNLSLMNQHRVTVLNHTLNPSTASAKMPSFFSQFRAYVDFRLECETPYDTSCPDWDRILSLSVGCSSTSPAPSNIGGFLQLQRWISSFHRTGGRWLTEITSLLPLLDGPFCSFYLTSGTTENWYYSADIVWDLNSPLVTAPSTVQYLWSGGDFNSDYNSIHPPITFTVAAGVKRVKLVAIISGHGCDSPNCCGEFCPTTHVFTVASKGNVSQSFSTSSQGYAGTQWGCANMGLLGAAPNQYGTFFYGRDFWCDSMYVPTWVWDITAALDLDQTNTITYLGLFDGQTPHPTSGGALISLTSYLSFYS